jgi:hypothetical protein
MLWIHRHRDDIALTLLILVLSAAVFIFFKTFFDTNPGGFTTEILAAFLGSTLTVMITMLLIKRQGSLEQAREAAVTSKTLIFEKKLELFRKFISIYAQSAFDGDLTADELEQLEELALVISLFSSDVITNDQVTNFGEDISRFVLQLELFGLRETLQPEDITLFETHLCSSKNTHNHKLMSFAHILQSMKLELGVAHLYNEPGTVPQDQSCQWAERLLGYRDYRQRLCQVTPINPIAEVIAGDTQTSLATT